MNVEKVAVDIKKLYSIIAGKTDDELCVAYKGTAYGQQSPWQARIGNREINAKTFDAAVETLRNTLLTELSKKTSDTFQEAERLSTVLNSLKN